MRITPQTINRNPCPIIYAGREKYWCFPGRCSQPSYSYQQYSFSPMPQRQLRLSTKQASKELVRVTAISYSCTEDSSARKVGYQPHRCANLQARQHFHYSRRQVRREAQECAGRFQNAAIYGYPSRPYHKRVGFVPAKVLREASQKPWHSGGRGRQGNQRLEMGWQYVQLIWKLSNTHAATSLSLLGMTGIDDATRRGGGGHSVHNCKRKGAAHQPAPPTATTQSIHLLQPKQS